MNRETPPLDQIYVQQVLPQDGSRRIVSLLDLSLPTDTLELYVAMMTCLWGLWVSGWALVSSWCCPWANLAASSNVLNLAFTFLPQWVWGLVGAVVGGMHLITRLHCIGLRRVWLLVDLMFWASVTMTVAVRVPHSTGIIAYGGLAFASGISYLRLYIIDHRSLITLRPWTQGH